VVDREQNNNDPGTVLIVDDNAANRLLLSSQLEIEGYKILQAANGKEGIEKVESERPDIVLLDVMMPIMNGFEMCAYVKAHEELAIIPIIMVTALRDVQYRIKGIEAGADEFLYRPHHREELLVRVRSLVQLKRTRLRLEEERNRLQLLYDVSRAVTTVLDLHDLMSSIIKYTQSAVQAAKGNIMLLNEKGDVTHKFLIRAGGNVEITSDVAQEVMKQGMAGWLVRHNEASIIVDATKDARWVQLPDDEEPAGSVIGVPLSRAERMVGVLVLIHPRPGYFTESHLALLETIRGQITTAIENAYLFNDIKEERRKLGALLAQSTDAIFTTDENWNVTLFNHAAASIFGMTASDVIGSNLRQVEALRPLYHLFENATRLPVVEEILLPEDTVLYASVSPVHDVGFVAVMQDVTEFKKVEARRLELERREKLRVKDTFTRYMGPSLAQHVLSTEPGILGMKEKRLATVMFADLRGFTRMIVNLEPSMAILVLNEYFSEMTDVVYEFEGTIFDLAGDELMVGFNVPIDQPDAPTRALRAAIEMQKRVDRLRQDLYAEVGTDVGLGIGLDQGQVVVGNVGAETRMNFAMVGEAVNTAHRLVDLAEDGQIMVSAGILQAISDADPSLLEEFTFESLGNMALKGKSRQEEVYRYQTPRTPLAI
jgi:PAS domain S-box-containing protein